MSNKYDFVIITKNKCPLKDAGAIRQHAFAVSLMESGFKPLVISYSSPYSSIETFDGISYISPSKKGSKFFFSKVFNQINFGKKALGIVKKICPNIKRMLVIDLLPNEYRAIKSFAKKFNIQLFHDSVEWYSKSEFKTGVFNYNYIFKNITNNVIIDKHFKVFSISKYLNNHFTKKGIKSIVVPVIMNVKRISCRTSLKSNSTSNKTVFIYAGSPDKKDSLGIVIQALNQIKNNYSFDFKIYGATENELVSKCGINKKTLQQARDYLRFYGRVPVETVRKALKDADYSILIRNSDERYAKAGFPTKVVESISCGTPVICNLSSDLGDYLIDGFNSYIVSYNNVESLKTKFEDILNKPKTEAMRKNARETALKNFDYTQHKNAITNFVLNIYNNEF